MNALLAPAVAVMDRLKFPLKFALLGVCALAAIGYLVVALSLNLRAASDLSRRELRGIAIATPALAFVQAAQAHRGLTTAALQGNDGMKAKAAAQTALVSQAVKAVDAAIAAHGGDFALAEEWAKVKSDWAELAGGWADLTGPANFEGHTALIGHASAFVATVSDVSGLAVDPDLGSFYLLQTATKLLPDTLEHLGRVRALGTGILARKAVTEDQRIEFGGRVGVLDKMMTDLTTEVARASKYHPDVKADLDRFVQAFFGAAADPLKIAQNEIVNGRTETASDQYFDKASGAIDIGYGEMRKTLLPTAEKLIRARLARLDTQFYLSLGLASLVILVLAYLSAGGYASVMRAVHSLLQGTQRIASGDLRARVQARGRDELRGVAEAFNSMAGAFSELIRNIQRSAAQVSESAATVAAAAGSVSSGSAQQSEAAATMAAAIQQMTVSIEEIGKNTANANGISERSGKLCDEGGAVVHDTVREISAVAAAVETSAQIIERLGKESEQITAIVRVIKDIADQTNLLALNAAIEAARAGESGRGFAVVADEVRKLAERTAKSTQEIATMVSGIQQGTAEAVEAMHQGVARVSGSVELANRAGEAMERIKQGAAQVVRSVADISLALQEQGAASTDIARNVERIARMAEENSAAAGGAANTAQNMQNLAAGLTSAVSRFNVV